VKNAGGNFEVPAMSLHSLTVMAGLVPAIHDFLSPRLETWMPGNADKFTQSAQDRLLCPGMTSFVTNCAF
jgi:hypothetical protein